MLLEDRAAYGSVFSAVFKAFLLILKKSIMIFSPVAKHYTLVNQLLFTSFISEVKITS